MHYETTTTLAPERAIAAADTTTRQHRFATKTTKEYEGNVRRGKEYLATLGDEFAGVFDRLSSLTPIGLRAFISWKCEEEGLSYKTGEAIRSSFKRYFSAELGNVHLGFTKVKPRNTLEEK